MSKDKLHVIREHILGATAQIVDDALPQMEKALVTAEGFQPSKLAISVTLKGDEETGDWQLEISGKCTIPTTKEAFKVRIDSGQLVLI